MRGHDAAGQGMLVIAGCDGAPLLEAALATLDDVAALTVIGVNVHRAANG